MKNKFYKVYKWLLPVAITSMVIIICTSCGKEEEYVDGVIPAQYSEDLSALNNMKYANSTYAYQDGKVYYRRYHEDSYEEAALWGNYGAIPGAKKKLSASMKME